MSELPFFSSQGSQYERHQILGEQESGSLSSPARHVLKSSPTRQRERPRKAPTVTPKRFTKFFTPRASLSSRAARQSKAGRQLRDITRNGGNRRPPAPLVAKQKELGADENISSSPLKRRRCSTNVPSSPPQSSPIKHLRTIHPNEVFESLPSSPLFTDDEDYSDVTSESPSCPRPIQRLHRKGCTLHILQRSFGGYEALTRGWRGPDHCADWQALTNNFYTTPTDIHTFSPTALPFCTASCNTNSLIAIGEEEGAIRLIDSSSTSDFSIPHVSFKPHSNAVMDMMFSADDYLFATASGDQTARLIDMQTQQTVCILSGHKSSVKQVRFHPNDNNIITTSSRDGSVMIWDMRCGSQGSVQALRTSGTRNVDTGAIDPPVRFAKHIFDVGTAFRARDVQPSGLSSRLPDSTGVSITSIQHLSHGREHLLLTSSEFNASIKVWDLRNASRRGGLSIPLSQVAPPPSHQRKRDHGINAMLLSGDGSRLYTACRDSTVYAYSTNHLVLGCASDTASNNKGKIPKTTELGVGPLYGFKNPDFRSASFYVKAAIRQVRADQSEMIAVGSSDGSPVLFPTDERFFRRREAIAEESDETDLPVYPPFPSFASKAEATSDTTIYEHGTALIGGHGKEVTSMTWSHDGELVTVSDDFTVRCWRENAAKARWLRKDAEGAEKWKCGWAKPRDSEWDEDDG